MSAALDDSKCSKPKLNSSASAAMTPPSLAGTTRNLLARRLIDGRAADNRTGTDAATNWMRDLDSLTTRDLRRHGLPFSPASPVHGPRPRLDCGRPNANHYYTLLLRLPAAPQMDCRFQLNVLCHRQSSLTHDTSSCAERRRLNAIGTLPSLGVAGIGGRGSAHAFRASADR